MSERPIMFSAPIVRAILDGRKTQTRRVVKPQPSGATPGTRADRYNRGTEWAFWLPDNRMTEPRTWRCPYGAPGDRLWVRETWGRLEPAYPTDPVFWRADYSDHELATQMLPRWRPAIHMPRWASRLTLEVTGVRVERLQAVSEEDARAEGVEAAPAGRVYPSGQAAAVTSYRTGFVRLWNEINGPRGFTWQSNPWVWVVEFKGVTDAG